MKEQEDVALGQESKESIGEDPGMTHLLGLLEKDILIIRINTWKDWVGKVEKHKRTSGKL